MKKTIHHIALASAVAGILGTAPAAYAHQYYNLTGAGTVVSGDSAVGFGINSSINGTDGVSAGSNGTNRVSDGTTTYNAATNNFISGTGSAAPTATEVPGNLPYQWYSGMHTKGNGYTKRDHFTGVSATDNASANVSNLVNNGLLPNGAALGGVGSWGAATGSNSLWRTYQTKNTGANASTWGTIMNDLPGGTGINDHPVQAVAGDSWATGQGLDYGLVHISCGANSAGDNCSTGFGDVKVTISVQTDSQYSQYNGLLDVALYRGVDTTTGGSGSSRTSNSNIGGTNPQGTDLGAPIWTATASSLNDILFYSFTFNQSEWLATDNNSGDGIHEHGFYTLFVGAHGAADASNGVVYRTLVTTSPVPVPAAAWLFGGAMVSLISSIRRKRVFPV